MNNWEYKIVTIGNGENKISYVNLENELNSLGENGWEVVGTFSPAVAPYCEYSPRIILKRQK